MSNLETDGSTLGSTPIIGTGSTDIAWSLHLGPLVASDSCSWPSRGAVGFPHFISVARVFMLKIAFAQVLLETLYLMPL